jgi:hypothetical protein
LRKAIGGRQREAHEYGEPQEEGCMNEQDIRRATLERIKVRIDTRLNDCLCEMKDGYDDSIVGFNEAWDIVRAVFQDEMKIGTEP